eukprot:6042532-Pleurochrysis_carterae.AAC.2
MWRGVRLVGCVRAREQVDRESTHRSRARIGPVNTLRICLWCKNIGVPHVSTRSPASKQTSARNCCRTARAINGTEIRRVGWAK